jgi:hypothetical protein
MPKLEEVSERAFTQAFHQRMRSDDCDQFGSDLFVEMYASRCVSPAVHFLQLAAGSLQLAACSLQLVPLRCTVVQRLGLRRVRSSSLPNGPRRWHDPQAVVILDRRLVDGISE